jgi:hypothetical protein
MRQPSRVQIWSNGAHIWGSRQTPDTLSRLPLFITSGPISICHSSVLRKDNSQSDRVSVEQLEMLSSGLQKSSPGIALDSLKRETAQHPCVRRLQSAQVGRTSNGKNTTKKPSFSRAVGESARACPCRVRWKLRSSGLLRLGRSVRAGSCSR